MVELFLYQRKQLINSLLRCKECGKLGYDIGHLMSITDECICINCYILNGGQIKWILENLVRPAEFKREQK